MTLSAYNQQADQLKIMADTTTSTELIFDLMRIFGSVTSTSLNRIREGKGNMAKDDISVIAKFGKPQRVVAYRPATAETLAETLEALKADPKALKLKARLFIVSDGRRIMAFDPKEEETYNNDIDTLWKDFDFFMPLAGIEKYQTTDESEADVKAAYIMAKVYDDIRRNNEISTDEQIHSLNIFLTRLLFCFFAEDTGIFENHLFSDSIHRYTRPDGSDLQEYIEAAFDIMTIESPLVRANMPKIIHQFPYVNGGLFKEHHPVPCMSRRTRDLILKCGGFNWQEINPDIFGSMIQAVVRPDQRAGLGLHYTSVPNIRKVICPLFLDSLWEAFADSRNDPKQLKVLLNRLSKIKFFDPACGSGNFLVIAYKEIRKLENTIWEQLLALNNGQSVIPFPSIHLTQFYGIEIDEFAHETAILSLWIAEHQMNIAFHEKFGTRPNALPLRPGGQIVHGNACRVDWNAVCPHMPEDEVYVMGNPPYLGSSMQDVEQKSDMNVVFAGYNSYKNLDYIACWFIKGAKYIQNTNAVYSFVTTNSICQGEQVAMLWKPIFEMELEIRFAYQSFKWSNSAKGNAGVTCAIIGIGFISDKTKLLFKGTAKQLIPKINAYLIEGSDTIIEKRSKPISSLSEMVRGNQPTDGGWLILSEDEKTEMIIQYPSSEKFFIKLLGSDEFINGFYRWCLWIDDKDLDEALKIPPILKRIENVRATRLASRDIGARKLAKRPHQFREFIKSTGGSTIIIPAVSSERREYIPMGFLGADTVISNSAFAIYNAQVWLFGILTSKMHIAWVKTVGGRLKTDYRYSVTLCYNTFPFPKITEAQRNEIEQYAEEVILTRCDFQDFTLAQLYDPDHMPQSLRDAHRALDLAVERCYRPEPFGTDEERLEYLFKMYDRITKIK